MATNEISSPDLKPPYFATFLALVAVITLLWLGTWQVQRGQEKAERLTQIQQRQSQSMMSVNELLAMSDPRDLDFEVTGELLADRIFLLDNRIENGQVGFHVLVPIRTNYGTLMVNFGWIRGNQDRSQMPSVSVQHGQVTLFGNSSIPNDNPMITETATTHDPWPKLIQQIDVAKMAELFGADLLPIVMQLDPRHPDGFVRNWVPVVMAPEKHYAYAMQWYGLALACLIIYIIALRKRKKTKHD